MKKYAIIDRHNNDKEAIISLQRRLESSLSTSLAARNPYRNRDLSQQRNALSAPFKAALKGCVHDLERKIKVNAGTFSEENLNKFHNLVDKPINQFVNELTKIITPKVNIKKKDIIERILAFRALQEGWDGYGAIPLEIEVASQAILLVTLLDIRIVEQIDDIFSNPNGTISILWENYSGERLSLDVGIKTLSFYIKLSNQKPTFYNKLPINTLTTDIISNYVRTL